MFTLHVQSKPLGIVGVGFTPEICRPDDLLISEPTVTKQRRLMQTLYGVFLFYSVIKSKKDFFTKEVA